MAASVLLGSPAGASELSSESDTGRLINECVANGLVAVYGQVWDDADGDDRLLEDAGIAGVSVYLALEGLADTQTDAEGFWAYCIDNIELLQIETSLVVGVPQSRVLVATGAGAEDEDSDVRTEDGLEARTEPFTIDQELTGRVTGSDELVPSQFEVVDRVTLRIDVGLASVVDLNPCPDWDAELLALDLDGDWDSDGLVNGVDPTPCDAGVGNPCPDQLPIHLEEDPGGDWDGDGIANAQDVLPCDDELLNPCPAWDDEVRSEFGEADWDEDGISNADDPLPCDPPKNPCPDASDLWVEQDAGGDWDDDGVVNAEDDDPCEPTPQPSVCPGFTVEDVERDPLGDWDDDGASNIDDEKPCDPVPPASGGGLPWSPWGPVAAVGIFVLAGGAIALTGNEGGESGPEERDKPRRPKATIKDVDLS